jgi:conjugal transfer pilus assembly protein TraK
MRRILFTLFMASTVPVLADDLPPELPFHPVVTSEPDPGKSRPMASAKPQSGPGPDVAASIQPVTGKKEEQATPARPENKTPGLPGPALVNPGIDSVVKLKPRPGETATVFIARNKLNRIVTPFQTPKVLTIDPLETKIDGSAIYVATDSQGPVSLFITDEDSGATVSLQLTPRDVALPVNIVIEQEHRSLGENNPGSAMTQSNYRQDSAYLTTIKTLMQALAKQQVPHGFVLQALSDAKPFTSLCQADPVHFKPGQILFGQGLHIVIMTAHNDSDKAVLFDEAFCATGEVLAVAAWPKVRLEPGEQTEVFVLLRAPEANSGAPLRPRLY